MPGGRLPRVNTELVILRVARLRSCNYEYTHHVRLGQRAGLTHDDITRVQAGTQAAGWTARQCAILTAVDELVHGNDMRDETWTALRDHLAERDCIELVMLVGHYEMLATTIAALRIQPDPPRHQ